MGAYKLKALVEIIEKETNEAIYVKGNVNTMKIEFQLDVDVNFTPSDIIRKMWGFSPGIYRAGKVNKFDLSVRLFDTTDIQIICSITGGTYLNNMSSHTLFEFDFNVESGFKLVKEPANILYLLIVTNFIRELTVTLTEQHQRLLELRDYPDTVRFELKPRHQQKMSITFTLIPSTRSLFPAHERLVSLICEQIDFLQSIGLTVVAYDQKSSNVVR